MIDALAELCDAGHADAVAVLAEHAHRRADEAVGYVDDPAGWLTMVSQRLGELHLRACAEGDPDAVELARRLVDLELTSELDGFHRAAERYAGVVGTEGLAEYRMPIEPRWEALRPQAGGWSSERFTLREAMAGLAVAVGDPDQLIEVHRDDLKTPDRYLEIARLLEAAGRSDEAETWAREGLERFAGRPWRTPPLQAFLADLLRGRGEPSAALELYREAFVRAPSLSTYRRLLDEAGEDADAARARALESLRRRLESTSDGEPNRAGSGLGGVLVEILAHEGEMEAAWQVAREHGCDQRLRMTLARAREATHPLDAVDVYEGEVFAQIDAKKKHTYRQAVDLLGRIRRLANDAGEPERFAEILSRVREEHARKRNLVTLLDQKGW